MKTRQIHRELFTGNLTSFKPLAVGLDDREDPEFSVSSSFSGSETIRKHFVGQLQVSRHSVIQPPRPTPPCPARPPRGLRDPFQHTSDPLPVILLGAAAQERAPNQRKGTNLKKATRIQVWKPVLPLEIYANFSKLLNFSEPQFSKEEVNTHLEELGG